MLFFSIRTAITQKIARNTLESDSFKSRIRNAAEAKSMKKGSIVLMTNITLSNATFLGIQKTYSRRMLGLQTREFLEETGLKAEISEINEITISESSRLLRNAERNDFVGDADDITEKIGLDDFFDRFGHRGRNNEAVIKGRCTRASAFRTAESLSSGTTGLKEEIGRIFSSRHRRFEGHPVHYAIFYGDDVSRKAIRELLLSSLYSAGRLRSRRIRTLLLSDASDFRSIPDPDDIRNNYNLQEDGALVVTLDIRNSESDGMKSAEYEILENLGKIISEYSMKVLTIIEADPGSIDSLERISEYADGVQFITIKEGPIPKEQTMQFLKKHASIDKIENIESLYDSIPDKEASHYPNELLKLYRTWRKARLCSEVYPQYSEAITSNPHRSQKPKGSAYKSLEGLIGLDEAKATINQIIDYMKAEKLFRDNSIEYKPISRHMVFTGNPGTAKTTAARLFAEIMKDNGLLSSGTFIEVGRKDIVSKYVGGTAPLVGEFFKRAKGGVLFIDEAYSLVEERGLYGDEAINTIVAEMENHRTDTIVIFAGYPDEMERFLDKNPGLRSRIAFHVHFNDYSADELLSILRLFASNDNLLLSTDAEALAYKIFEISSKDKNAGNGRFVRNIFEKAKMRHASRIIRHNDNMSFEDIRMLTADDFEIPGEMRNSSKQRQIGFV